MRNYWKKYKKLTKRRYKAEGMQFIVYGVLSGLILSGLLGTSPLFVGTLAGVVSGLSLVTSIWYAMKHDEAKNDRFVNKRWNR